MESNSSFEQNYYENDALWAGPNSEKELGRITEVISIIPDDAYTVLDVGCGNGILINLLEKKYPKITRLHGFDRSKSALKYVKTEKSAGDINNLPFKDQEFDMVICLEVLEHLPKPIFKMAINELARVKKIHNCFRTI